jgi:hypothetical protein
MYKIERKTSGYLLTFSGNIDSDEMEKWVSESQDVLASEPGDFGVIVDMRNLAPLAPEVQQIMVKGQQAYKEKGMKRSAVVVNNAVTKLQFQRLAKESGIDAWERYIDGSATQDWAKVAVAWVKDGVDPD